MKTDKPAEMTPEQLMVEKIELRRWLEEYGPSTPSWKAGHSRATSKTKLLRYSEIHTEIAQRELNRGM